MTENKNEGLLYQKIQESVKDSGVDADVLKVWDGKRYDFISLDTRLKEVLDEAKKDFPTTENIIGTYEPSEYDIIAHAGFSSEVLETKREEWFQKWFGEPE